MLLALTFLQLACDDGLDQAPIEENTKIELTPIQKQELRRQELRSFELNFVESDFYSVSAPNRFNCAGDAKIFRDPWDRDAFGVSKPFETSLAHPSETIKPAFIRNISVDLTHGNEEDNGNFTHPSHFCHRKGPQAPPPRACAFFDQDTYFPLPQQQVEGINSGFYTLEHLNCNGSGPVVNQSRNYAGGVDIDLNQEFIGENEEILVQLKFFPFGNRNLRNFVNGTGPITRLPSETARFKVHLSFVDDAVNEIQSTFQPRYFQYFNSSQYPQTVTQLINLSSPQGFPIEKQFTLSSALKQRFNRIRIERLSGSGILVSLRMFLMGQR